jgi:hypothetical protein
VQLGFSEGFAMITVVADQVFAEGVCQHLVHVDSNSFHYQMVSPGFQAPADEEEGTVTGLGSK